MKRLFANLIHAIGRRLRRRGERQLPAPEETRRILVTQFHYIGDVFFTTSAIAALQRRFPNAAIDAVVKTRGRDVLIGNPAIYEIIVFDKLCNDRTREPATDSLALFALARRLRGYDLLVDFTGVPASCALAALTQPRWSAGFSRSGFGFVFDQELWPAPDIPFVEKYNALAAMVGADAAGIAPQVFLDPGSAGILPAAGPETGKMPALPGVDVLLHVGAGFSLKQWGAGNFRAVAEHFRARGLHVAIVGGPGDDAEITNLSIREVAALARGCRVYVGLDTGLTHIVASLGVPTVAIYGPTNPRFSQLARPNVHVVRIELTCSPAPNQRQCVACRPMFCSHHSCMRLLDASRITQEIERCLDASFTSSPS